MSDHATETQLPAIRLETAKSEFEYFFENTLNPMIVAGLDGYMCRVNQACERLAGFTAAELKSQPYAALIHPDDREAAQLVIMEMMTSRIGRRVEIRVVCKDGAYKWTEWMGTPTADGLGFYLIGEDVTERRNAREALAERIKQREAVATLGQLALVSRDLGSLAGETVELLARTLDVPLAEVRELLPDGRATTLKAGFGWRETPHGLDPISTDPDTVSGYMLSANQPVIVEDLRQETRFHGSAVLREHEVVSGIGCVIRGPQRPYGVLAAYSNRLRKFTSEDVRFLEAAASVLAAAIERQQAVDDFDRLFDNSPDLMMVAGFDGCVQRMNAPVGATNYLAPEDVKNRRLLDFVHPDDKETLVAQLQKLFAEGAVKPFEIRSLMKDGSYDWFSWSAAAFADRQVLYAAGQNTTDRHLVEEALAQRARQQQAVAELGTRALAGGDLTELMNDAAAVVAETLGAEYSEILELLSDEEGFLLKAGRGWRPEQLGEFRVANKLETVSGYLLANKTPVTVEDSRRDPRFPESPVWREHDALSGMACLIPGPTHPYGVLAVHSPLPHSFSENDVHFLEATANILATAIERKRGEQERERFFDRTMTPMMIIGYDGSVKYVNPATSAVCGFTREELLASPYLSFVHPDEVTRVAKTIPLIIQGKSFHAFEVRIRCKDDSYKWFAFDSSPDPDRQAFYAIAHDVTDRHVAEEALLQRTRQQEAVTQLGRIALAASDLTALFNDAVSLLTRTLGAEYAEIMELAPGGREVLLKAGFGWHENQIGKLSVAITPETVTAYLLDNKAPVVVEDLPHDPRFQGAAVLHEQGAISGIACLIPGVERPYGPLAVHWSRRRTLSENDIRFLEAVANTLAAAIERKRREEELERFFDRTLSPMLIIGFDGSYKYANAAAAAYCGVTREELLSRPYFSFFHPDDIARVEQLLPQLFAGTPLHDVEVRIRNKEGAFRWFTSDLTPDLERNSFYVITHDVTDRHKAETALRASEETLRVTAEAALDGIVLLGPDGNVSQWNAAAQRIFGYAREEILGRDLHQILVPPETREQYEKGFPHFQETGEGAVIGKLLELEAVRKDGSLFPVEVSVAALSLHGKWNAVGVIRDITQRKADEQRLRDAKVAAEAANRAKSEFLANMSHEIRTPMNGVIGLTSLVLDTPLSSEQRQYLDGVMLSAEALLKIINDILDFSKIEAGRLELERIDFDLRETLGNTMQTLALRAHEKELELTYDVKPEAPDALVGDPARLWQVLVNLVGNAVKFTDQGEVSVSVGVEELKDESVCLQFTVADTGIGIPTDKHQTLFRPFSQIDSSMSRKYGGTGLGLAISAQIVEMMKGRIWFESELGQGSKFHFTAWFDRRTTPLPKRAPLPPSALDNLRVLVVDDNSTNRTILRNMLTHWGMRPDEAEGGTIALDALQAAHKVGDPFGLILLDVMMPGMDGFEVLKRINQMPEIARPVILMLSSRDQPGDAARANELGAAAYIVKPIRPSELLDAIVKALGISLAAPAERPAVSPPTVEPAARGPKLRILVAEDNPINQMLAVRMLEKAGHSVAVANNGEEALAAVARESFDLVMMDVQMPVIDGFEATALIRQQEQGTERHLPIVAMTAHAMKGDRERCLESGMDGYVAKPVQREELFSAIAAAVPAAMETSQTPSSRDGH